jgi:hypothetical protein
VVDDYVTGGGQRQDPVGERFDLPRSVVGQKEVSGSKGLFWSQLSNR